MYKYMAHLAPPTTLILEKKMPLNGAITAKYKEHKRVNPHDMEDWEFAMRRFFS